MFENESDEGIDLQLEDDVMPAVFPNEDVHDDMVAYLCGRLDSQRTIRETRVARYEEVDRAVSTWQVLDDADKERKRIERETGKPQAVKFTLPVAHTQIDDMTAFYASVFSPTANSFYQMPDSDVENQEGAADLLKRMNQDAKKSKYHKHLCSFLRTALKYNIGGFSLEWVSNGSQRGRNAVKSLDMYNFLWDPLVADPADIPHEAEWAATISVQSGIVLSRKEHQNVYLGVGRAVGKDALSQNRKVKYYKTPPKVLQAEESEGPKWDAVGAGIEDDYSSKVIGHEVVDMYCWVNPKQLKFELPDREANADKPQLWRFVLIDGEHIVYARPHGEVEDAVIPYYVGFMDHDSVGESHKSVAERLQDFQGFASFLLNVYVSGMRKNVWGFTVYDPKAIDFKNVGDGSTAMRIPTKVPGRDVRSVVWSDSHKADIAEVLPNLNEILRIMQNFFPAQALPSQIASMDRAVSSQVQAVMQGTNRRLHMVVQIMEADVIAPLAFAQYQNINRYGDSDVSYEGLTDDVVRGMLGSGLQQLNREAAEGAMRQLLFAIIQNPESAAGLDVIKLMDYWGRLTNIDIDLDGMRKEVQDAGGEPDTGVPADSSPTGIL